VVKKEYAHIRMPPKLRQKADKRAAELEKTFSEYIRSLVEADIQKWENEKKGLK